MYHLILSPPPLSLSRGHTQQFLWTYSLCVLSAYMAHRVYRNPSWWCLGYHLGCLGFRWYWWCARKTPYLVRLRVYTLLCMIELN